MSVYFIKPIGMDGPIKIGCSCRPGNRRQSLEFWSPFPLEIIAEIPGDQRLERRFHARFEAAHIRSEWSHPVPDLLTAIAAIRAGMFGIDTLPAPRYVTGRKRVGNGWTDKSRLTMTVHASLRNLRKKTGKRVILIEAANKRVSEIIAADGPIEVRRAEIRAIFANHANHTIWQPALRAVA